jgi:2-polyprenyl-6-methoxyphenol hydroxylase-like FAD-dependent oxidoreductase
MTPNLGQGGCTALEDAVVLARTLSQTASQTSSSAKQLSDALVPALREYESGRSRRCFPITARSYAMGAAMQIPFPPVTLARDLVVSSRVADGLLIGHFLDHTRYDAGTLLQPAS